MHHSHQLDKQEEEFFLPFEFKGFDRKTYLSDFLNGIIDTFTYIITLLLLYLLQGLVINKYDIFSEFLDKYPLVWGLYVPIYFVIIFAIGYFMKIPKKIIFLLPHSIHHYFIKVPREHRIGIDKKKQLLFFANEAKKFTIPLEDIRQMKFSFQYVQEDDSAYKDMCNLKLVLEFKVKKRTKKRILTAQFRKIYFPKWETFLAKLPSHISIKNLEQ